tara:strand:- start:1004 stop:1786 length:783 start_codon:yes stop_codon:yes gene_type:complete
LSNNSITVLISTFDPKRKKLLLRAINSIIHQSHKPKEIIIADNNVKLNNKLLVKKFNKKKNIKFKYIKYTKPGGAFAVRNFIIKNLKTNYIAFLDDDDFWHRDYLKEFNRINHNKNYDLILTNTIFKKKNEKNKVFHIDYRDFSIEKIGLYNPGIRSSATIVKRKSFVKVKGYDLKLYHGSADKDFLVKILNNKMKIKIIEKPTVFYTLHPNSHSTNNKLMLKSIIGYYKKHRKEISIINKFRYAKKISYLLLKSILYKN